MKNIIAIKTNCYNGYSLDEAIEGIKKAGFRYLELHASPGNSLNISRKEPIDKMLALKERFEKEGLIPIASGGHTNICDPDIEEELISNLRFAKFFNCRYFVTNIGNPNGLSNDEIADKIKYYLPYLEEYDLDMVIEIHGVCSKGSILKDIVKRVNFDRVHINYDTANSIFYQQFSNEELLKDIEDSMDSISYMHLKDKLGEKNEWNFPAIGKGYVPLVEIFELLNKHENNCPLTCEIEFVGDRKMTLEEIDQAVKDSADYMREKGFVL